MDQLLTLRRFVTHSDTKFLSVTISYHFYLRSYTNRFGLSQVYLSVSWRNKRKRIKLDVEGPKEFWDKKKQRFRKNAERHNDLNLILDNINNKIVEIITTYRLQDRTLTLSSFLEEYYSAVPKNDFVSFCRYVLNKEIKKNVCHGTYKRHKAVLNKLEAYKPEITFHELDSYFIESYKTYLRNVKNNQSTTISANLSAIKKYIGLAEKLKIRMPITAAEIKCGSTKGNRIHLQPEEVKKLRKFYFSEFINDKQRLILGYFLFSCFTGLRYSDVMELKRPGRSQKHVEFVAAKTSREKNTLLRIAISDKLREIINDNKQLFVKKLTGQYINRELKVIAKFLKVNPKITFHVARHTFATNYLKAGGTVEKLQHLLGHSDYKETLTYVHIVEQEAQQEVLNLDELY